MSSREMIARLVQMKLEAADVFWLYDGSPRADVPHAELTSGKHSDGYVNVGQFLQARPEMCSAFGTFMLQRLKDMYFGSVDWVVGADTSSTGLALVMANFTGAGHIRMVKTEDEAGKRQVWHLDNTPLADGEVILHIEELLTTSVSALQVRDGIRQANPGVQYHFVPFLPVVVERSDPDNRVRHVEESIVSSLLQLSIRNFDPEQCPYCAVGSEALKPKQGDNWSRLTGKA